MTLAEKQTRALAEVQAANPGGTNFKVVKSYENFLDGVLITIGFQGATPGKEESSHVHFTADDLRVYRLFSDVLTTVANHKERSWFFRFLEFAGVGGLIAFILVIVFSILLSVLAFSNTQVNPSIVEVVKLSFTTILGYFFGSQSATRK